MSREVKLAVIPGDGIGVEVVAGKGNRGALYGEDGFHGAPPIRLGAPFASKTTRGSEMPRTVAM